MAPPTFSRKTQEKSQQTRPIRLGCAIAVSIAMFLLAALWPLTKAVLRYQTRRNLPAKLVDELEKAYTEPIFFPEEWRNPPMVTGQQTSKYYRFWGQPLGRKTIVLDVRPEYHTVHNLLAGYTLPESEMTTFTAFAESLLPYFDELTSLTVETSYSMITDQSPIYSAYLTEEIIYGNHFTFYVGGLQAVVLLESYRCHWDKAFAYCLTAFGHKISSPLGNLACWNAGFRSAQWAENSKCFAYAASHCTDAGAIRKTLRQLNEWRNLFKLPAERPPSRVLAALMDLQLARSHGYPTPMKPGLTSAEYVRECIDMNLGFHKWLSGQPGIDANTAAELLDYDAVWQRPALGPLSLRAKTVLQLSLNPDALLIRSLTSPYTLAETTEKEVFCYYDLTRIFLAARLYELEKGEKPSAVSQLVKDYLEMEPMDPYSGKCFLHDPPDQQFYSVGINKNDEGGPQAGLKGPLNDDIKAMPRMDKSAIP